MKNRRKIKIYGERNSGTRYLTKLIELNLDAELLPGSVPRTIRLLGGHYEGIRDLYFWATYRQNLGWKHAMAPTPAQVKALHMDGVLFITLTKNPYAWLLSMYRRPYHQRQSEDSFAAFLQSKWPTVARENYAQAFPNPLVMWNEKNRSYLSLNQGACVRNLRYEDLLRNPEAIVAGIASEYSIPKKQPNFVNVTQSTKPEPGKQFEDYQTYYLEERWRSKLDPDLLALINPQLDREVVTRFGYELVC
ncbi:MAG: hypothetical protein IT328_14185 [Caldilineaceae bacterium]|nr:hypothetical protein [Caldilineaceae bacterium]